MKAGKVGKLFGIDPKTVRAWTQEFSEFFSHGAIGEGDGLQRDYATNDLYVLNLIFKERGKRTPVEQIRAKLEAGERDSDMPTEFYSIEGENAVAVYSQLRVATDRINSLTSDVERLERERNADREKIEQLNRQIGRLEAERDIYKKMLDERGEK
jgi:DNA-binding transcriptional MerR regulator